MRVKRQIFWQRVMNLGCGGVDIFALHIYESWVRNHLSFEENTARYQFALSRDDHDFWICFVLPVNKQGYQLKLVASLQMINKLLLIWHKEQFLQRMDCYCWASNASSMFSFSPVNWPHLNNISLEESSQVLMVWQESVQ